MIKIKHGINDLKTTHPDLCKQWHPTKNGALLPEQVSAGSGKTVWWQCESRHEWEAVISNRSKGIGCPYCSGKRVSEERSLAILYPNLLSEWNYEKNKDLTPYQVSPGMGKKVWWICTNSHEWEAVIQSRVRGNGCPYCSNSRVLKGYNDLATIKPELLKDWDYEKNDKSPDSVSAGTPQKVWWKCNKCGYEWNATVGSRTSRKKPVGCPACAGKVVKNGLNDLETLYPNIAKLWHPSKNDNLLPKNVSAGSGKKVWWLGECGHEWIRTIHGMVKSHGCPYCNRIRKLKGFSDFASLHPELLCEWDAEKNSIKPDEVSAKSSKKAWWICHKGHSYCMRIGHRAEGHGCPYCAGEKPIIGYNDLATTHSELCKEWHPTKNILKPSEVMKYTAKKVWWLGKCGHEWEAKIDARVLGAECPYCNPSGTSFPEQALFYYLKKIFPDVQNRYRDFGFELDIYIPSINVAIEYDGIQFHKEKSKQIKDNTKDDKCIEKGINLIRIREGDLPSTNSATIIKRDEYWREESLTSAIKELFTILNKSECVDISIERDYGSIRSDYYQLRIEKSLEVLCPDLAKEWDYEKNHSVTPKDVTPQSNRKIWWKCKYGHSWRTTAYARYKSTQGCPYCSGFRIITGKNDLTTLNPDLMEEWDYSKNTIDPTMIKPGSSKRAWWKCSKCGYEWSTTINQRSIEGTGCPACSNKQVVQGLNDLATMYPQIASEWHQLKNGVLTPDSVVSGSYTKAWWKCSKCGHEWETTIVARTKNHTGCPRCANRGAHTPLRPLSENTELLNHWDYDRNTILPNNISMGSNKMAWWKCDRGHSFQMRIRWKNSGNKCPICANRRALAGFNDLTTTHPEMVFEWDYEKNKTILPQEVTFGSDKKVWWICQNGHSYQTAIAARTGKKHAGCPYCSGKKLMDGFNDLESSYPQIAAEWHHELNGNLLPNEVSKATNRKVWWLCKNGHSYYSSINGRTLQGLGCPYCSGQKVLAGYNDIATTHPELAKEWHPTKNIRKPTEVSKGSNIKVWWKAACGHEWEESPNNRGDNKNCPYCSSHRLLKGFNDLGTKYPQLASEWNYGKNEGLPSSIMPHTNKKYWWRCSSCGNEWEDSPNNRIRNPKCPRCKKIMCSFNE